MTWGHYSVSLAGVRQAPQPHTAYATPSVISLFSGPWADIATKAFTRTFSQSRITKQLVRQAYQNAVDATAAEWNRIAETCEDDSDLFGQGAADGACAFLEANQVTSFWLGATPVIHFRATSIHNQNRPHTLYNALIAQGHRPDTDRHYRVQYKSFVHEPRIESSVWRTHPGDRILILPYTVSPSTIATFSRRPSQSLPADVQYIAEAAAPDCQPMSTTVIMSELLPR